MKCKECDTENLDGTKYCCNCGAKLKLKMGKASWGGSKPLAGVGQKGSSLAPLGAMAIKRQSAELGKVTTHTTLIKVVPKEDSTWYCPDCGELNPKFSTFCKGCGRDYV